MALLDKIKNKKRLIRAADGSLQYATDETINQRSSAVGSQPPTSPLGVKGLGDTTEQQAAMAGTKAQTTGALSAIQRPDDQTLATQQRRQQQRQQMTGAEQAAFEKSETLTKLGGLGDRIHKMISQEVAGLQASTDGLQVAEDLESQLAQGALETNDVAGLRTALEQLSAGNSAALVTINKALGKAPDAPLTAEEIQALYQDVDDSTAAEIAKQMPDQFMVSNDLATGLGLQGIDELATLLGRTPEELQTLSLTQLDEEVNRVRAEEYSQVEALRARMTDPAVSAAEKQAIGDQLRALGATGVRAGEEQVEATLRAVEEAPEAVEFAGRMWSLDELLDDENISGLIKEYLQNPDSALGEQLPAELKDFVENNREVLEDAAEEVDTDVSDFVEIQETNLGLSEAATGQEIDERIMDTIFGEGWDEEFRTELLDTSKYPGFQLLSEDSPLKPDQQATLVDSMNQIADVDPDLAKQLMELSPKELRRLGATTNSKSWRNYMRLVKKAPDIEDARNLDELLGDFFGIDVNGKAIENMWKENARAEAMGFKVSNEYRKYKDFLGAKLNPKDLKKKLLAAIDPGNIKNYKKKLPPSIGRSPFMDPRNGLRVEDSLYGKVKHQIANGIQGEDARDMARDLSMDDLNRLVGMNIDGTGTLKEAVRKNLDSKANVIIERYEELGNHSLKQIQDLVDKYNQGIDNMDNNDYMIQTFDQSTYKPRKVLDGTAGSMIEDLENYVDNFSEMFVRGGSEDEALKKAVRRRLRDRVQGIVMQAKRPAWLG